MAITEEFDAQLEPNSFPNTPLFHRVVKFANSHRLSQNVVFRDYKQDIEANHADLLADIVELRAIIFQRLPSTAHRALEAKSDVYVGLIADASYEWLVGCLSIMSLGAAILLLGTFDPFAVQIIAGINFECQSPLCPGSRTSIPRGNNKRSRDSLQPPSDQRPKTAHPRVLRFAGVSSL